MTASTPTPAAPAIYTPRLGDVVLCCYRLPTPWQFWVHPVHVGVVQEPGDDPNDWNGRNSERHSCQTCGKTPVLYNAAGNRQGPASAPFRQHDATDSLCPAPEGRVEPWAVQSEAEGYDLEYRALSYCSRCHKDRCKLLELAYGRHGGIASAIHAFASTRQVQDEAHRGRLLGELDQAIADHRRVTAERFERDHEDNDLQQLLRLRGLAKHAPAGVELARDADLFAG